jgi:hypothetical protein
MGNGINDDGIGNVLAIHPHHRQILQPSIDNDAIDTAIAATTHGSLFPPPPPPTPCLSSIQSCLQSIWSWCSNTMRCLCPCCYCENNLHLGAESESDNELQQRMDTARVYRLIQRLQPIWLGTAKYPDGDERYFRRLYWSRNWRQLCGLCCTCSCCLRHHEPIYQSFRIIQGIEWHPTQPCTLLITTSVRWFSQGEDQMPSFASSTTISSQTKEHVLPSRDVDHMYWKDAIAFAITTNTSSSMLPLPLIAIIFDYFDC